METAEIKLVARLGALGKELQAFVDDNPLHPHDEFHLRGLIGALQAARGAIEGRLGTQHLESGRKAYEDLVPGAVRIATFEKDMERVEELKAQTAADAPIPPAAQV